MLKHKVYINTTKLDKDRWDDGELRSYKRKISIVVGDRRVGKTFKFTIKMVKRSLEIEDLAFIWLRINKTECDELLDKFMDDIVSFDVFPDYVFRRIGNYWYAKKKEEKAKEFPICYISYIKNAVTIKGIPFPTCQFIVLDEFMEENTERRCKNKVNLFFSIVYSVFALRTIKCFLIGNAVTINDPFFKYYGITNIDRAWTKGKDFVIENVNYEEKYKNFRAKAKASDFGKMVKGSDYEKYALDNKFMLDDYTGIDEDIKPTTEAILILMLDKNYYVGCYNEKNYFLFRKVKNPINNVIVTPFSNLAKKDIIYMKYNTKPYISLFTLALSRETIFYSNFDVKTRINELKDKALGKIN